VAEAELDVELDADLDDERPLRWYLIAAFVLAVVAGFAAAVWFIITWGVGCSKIDDGLSDVAGDSMRASLCQSGHGVAVLLVPAGWVLGLVLATAALMRWGGGLRGTVLLVLMLLMPALLPAAAYAGLHRASTSCSDDELAAYRQWVDAGSKGTAPYDCRTF
jgi:hypothetical protein